jgi:hypothetical protein
MGTIETEFVSSDSITLERPSKEFLLAVSKLLETNEHDLLSELGYVAKESIVDPPAYAVIQ